MWFVQMFLDALGVPFVRIGAGMSDGDPLDMNPPVRPLMDQLLQSGETPGAFPIRCL